MANTGKNGSDTIYKALKKIAMEFAKFGPKLIATAAIMQAGGQLTAAEYATVVAFINSIAEALVALQKVAEYSGFDPKL